MNQQFRMRAKFPEFKEALSGLSLDDPKVRRFNEFSRIFDRDAVNSRFGVELRADAKQGEELRLAGAIGDDAINLDLLTEPVLSRLSRISIRISGYSSAATYFFR
ncbi:hypothetical protein HYT84_04690, partial [Candidatus Micrarchaeota archaeon]|nr:hypothetical protein [Candidatus Micrarchaeota archaeon]